ncbi:adenylate/guanylate cyclase domain-containing protein [Actinomadura sp. KC345]|uniref:adenylate/guanylate cyclase domain-containing protein n=1 Tax=Actinomadura sp. KC345 TaxID=2530371 RepID=UPI001A9FC0D6|nr:adenylate/guanylate cyclase domain-containing protein [Actinomadura sp. KC345]
MEGNGNTQLIYRLLLAVDIQGYSKRDTREQLIAQRRLSDALDRAAHGVGLDRARWDKQVGGDGELATLPDGIDPAPVAGDFVIGLAEALREVNGDAGRFPLRVRLSLHHGTLTAGPFGPAGDAPIVVQRLLDAAPLRRLLASDADRDLAYVVSDSLFEDVVRTGFCALRPRDFQAIKVTAKGAAFRGHILTGRAARRDGAGGGRGGPDTGSAPGARVLDFPALAAR